MKKFLVTSALVASLSACASTAPEPLCDRSEVRTDKRGKVILAPECSPRPKPRPVEKKHEEPDNGDGTDRPWRDGLVDQPDGGPDDDDQTGGDGPDGSDGGDQGLGNPGNDKPVGGAGENPNNKGGWGSGDRGMSR